MIIKSWSGNIKLNEITVEVRARIVSKNNVWKEWNGEGRILSLNDAAVLFKQVGDVFDTEIGTLFINRIDPINQTFSFQGTGTPLF